MALMNIRTALNDWMNRREYENQKLSERHPFTVQEFSEELSAILAKQIVQKGTDTGTEILSLLKRFVPDVNWPVRIGKIIFALRIWTLSKSQSYHS